MNTKLVVNHIVSWLETYAKNAATNGFVVGVSGGIDSAVTSKLCALTEMKTLCLEMPIHQSSDQVSRARKHIDALELEHSNISSREIELTDIFDSFVYSLPTPQDRELHEFSLVNARARMRMTTLYYFAGIHKLLVAGTGNKVEDFGVGFYTKYGDGGVDLSPIADLNKTEVYELGSYLGIIPEIMNAPPTDGLWGDNRTDEDQIGASYPELEWAMEFNGSENEISERQREVLDIYKKLHNQNKHKMVSIPVCDVPNDLKKS